MTDIATTLQRCHQIVWAARAELESYWPTPNTRDAARFAMCEACEALDAWLRLIPAYARNNDKTLSVDDELCDCMMMMLTAIGKDSKAHGDWDHVVALSWDEHGEGLDAIVVQSAMVLKRCEVRGYDRTWRELAWEVCSEIALYVGPAVLPLLTARLERIKAKRIPPPKVTVTQAFAELREASGGAFDNITDVDAWVAAVRNGDDPSEFVADKAAS